MELIDELWRIENARLRAARARSIDRKRLDLPRDPAIVRHVQREAAQRSRAPANSNAVDRDRKTGTRGDEPRHPPRTADSLGAERPGPVCPRVRRHERPVEPAVNGHV